MRAEVKLTKTVVNDRIPKVLAPTADGQVDIPAIIVREQYGENIQESEVSRYHPMDSTHIRVRRVRFDGSVMDTKTLHGCETVLHIGQLSPTHPLYEAAHEILKKS
jgi:hypothetical protein